MANEKKAIVIKDVIAMIEDGKTRKDIQTELGLTGADTTKLFQDKRLKGKRAKKQPGFFIVDDTAEPIKPVGNIAEGQKVQASVTETGSAL